MPRGMVRLADNGLRTWNCGIGEEKVGLDGDLVSGTGICVIDGPRVGLDPVIELCPPARLNSKAEIAPWSWEQKLVLSTAVPRCPELCWACLGGSVMV